MKQNAVKIKIDKKNINAVENDLIDYDMIDLVKKDGKEHLKLNEPTVNRVLAVAKIYKIRFFDFNDFYMFWLYMSGFLDKERAIGDIELSFNIISNINPQAIQELRTIIEKDIIRVL